MRRLVSILVALVTLSGVGAVAWWGYTTHATPGPLHPSHAAVVKLRGNGGCAQCHAGDGGAMSKACLACHKPISEQAKGRAGLHGVLEPAVLSACEACHREHLGETVALVSADAFARAGVADRARYAHAHVVGFSLAGAHSALACEKCHRAASADALAPGEKRFLGLSQTCTGCHEDVHKGDLSRDCASCHGQERPFKEAPAFQHPGTFPLALGHASVACVKCHETRGVYTGLKTECASCHMDAYEKTTSPAHRSTGLGTRCDDCHGKAKWTEGVRFEHPKEFALTGAHAKGSCVDCHRPGPVDVKLASFKADGSCAACHASPHTPAMEAATAALLGGGRGDVCTVCHEGADLDFGKGATRVSFEVHAVTGFPLKPPHDIAGCVKCHSAVGAGSPSERTAAYRAAYPGRGPQDCRECHKDPHGGQFADTPTAGRCAECHETTRFEPNTFDLDRHDATAFPLTGSHRAVACAACHKEVDKVRRFVGTGTACAGCHEDVHRGTFDRADSPKDVNGRTGCARCHNTVSFSEVAWSAEEHERWGGYALAGAHATAACARCHRRQEGARAPAFAAAPTKCAACHADPHSGQFVRGGENDCARCHQGTASFGTLAFDHQRDARFALDADHAKLGCAACHKPYDVGGAKVVRYRPLGIACADCHDSRGLTGGPK